MTNKKQTIQNRVTVGLTLPEKRVLKKAEGTEGKIVAYFTHGTRKVQVAESAKIRIKREENMFSGDVKVTVERLDNRWSNTVRIK